MEKSGKLITIRENHLFSRLYSKGKSFSGRLLALYCLKNYKGRETATKFGITVSKSRGNAVVRNRVKRRIKEALRLLYPFIKEGFLVVVVARQAAVAADYGELSEELYDLLKRAALLGKKE